MQKQQKDLLRTLVRELRHRLAGSISPIDGKVERGDLDRELERLGFAPDGSIKPIDALPDALPRERYAYQVAATQLSHLPLSNRRAVREEIIERAAYTWINRLLALRAMEVRGLIDDTLRSSAVYGDISEKLYILRQSEPERSSGEDGGWWTVLEEACEEQARSLPGLFALNDPSAALRPSPGIIAQCAALVSGPIADFSAALFDAAFADPDAIGWAYQFYQEESKALIDAKCKAGGKVVSRAEAAAKTQLFTEPYMVQWLLQNSLGRSYHEAHPQSMLPASWPYYVQPETLDTSAPFELEHLTLLDPCVGSGHFLRAAFDMYVAMYREQYPTWSAQQIADRILAHHLHGIDLDPRAAQLSALTLYLRAWELLCDERLAKQLPGPGRYVPPAMNLATTPTNLNTGLLERHLSRHQEDRLFLPLIEDIFAALEQASTLGSLLRPREYLDHAISTLQKQPAVQRNLFSASEDDDLRLRIAAMAKDDPEGLKQLAFERITASFQAEAGNTDDISAMLFGREAIEGVRLLQMLDRQYAVVVTNPPYMGSKHMDTPMKRFVERYYAPGKRDVYAAFILRCKELCKPDGRVAMVTMQSWMFLRSFAELRAVPPEKLTQYTRERKFTGLLRETRIDVLAQLGANAFEEISGEVVQSAMYVLCNKVPKHDHKLNALRLPLLKDIREKIAFLQKSRNAINVLYEKEFRGQYVIPIQYNPFQSLFTSISESPLSYWLSNALLEKLVNSAKMKYLFYIKGGLSTTDNNRFVRCHWETSSMGRWVCYTKGGGYNRWAGNNYYTVDWEFAGARMKAYIVTIPGNSHWSRRIFNSEFYFMSGYTYSSVGQGTLAVRKLGDNSVLGHKGPGIFAIEGEDQCDIAGIYNTRVMTYLLRALAPQLGFEVNHLLSLPKHNSSSAFSARSANASKFCVEYKQKIVEVGKLADYSFICKIASELDIIAYLLTFEAYLELITHESYAIDEKISKIILLETGAPSGWYPLIVNYDSLPLLSSHLDLPALPEYLLDYLSQHDRITPTTEELASIKSKLRALYEAGPDAKDVEQQQEEQVTDEADEAGIASGAHIPIPTETFLEALSVKMQLHPISVYWLLEELRAEGVRCKPEERRMLEDRLSVLVLRLLGHRWPGQIEAGEPVPEWAEGRGAIPLVGVPGKATLAGRVRERLRVEDGPKGAQETEALLEELTGQSLEEWLRRTFFTRHISQFKHRPVVWHLTSAAGKASGQAGKRRGGTQRRPVFECFLYYHACTSNMLARIRHELVEPLILFERGNIVNSRDEQRLQETLFPMQADQDAAQKPDETAAAIANERVRELEAFVQRLRQIEEQGFACEELQRTLAEEPLDRWAGDGYQAPGSREELLRVEGEWHVDINDGVRINIAPLQLGGVLAGEVLKTADARKAIADRVRWRADERRWVREGKLPRCGWLPDAVPASPRWDELEPQRLAEQHKLEQKRLLLQQGALLDEQEEPEASTEEEEVLQ